MASAGSLSVTINPTLKEGSQSKIQGLFSNLFNSASSVSKVGDGIKKMGQAEQDLKATFSSLGKSISAFSGVVGVGVAAFTAAAIAMENATKDIFSSLSEQEKKINWGDKLHDFGVSMDVDLKELVKLTSGLSGDADLTSILAGMRKWLAYNRSTRSTAGDITDQWVQDEEDPYKMRKLSLPEVYIRDLAKVQDEKGDLAKREELLVKHFGTRADEGLADQMVSAQKIVRQQQVTPGVSQKIYGISESDADAYVRGLQHADETKSRLGRQDFLHSFDSLSLAAKQDAGQTIIEKKRVENEKEYGRAEILGNKNAKRTAIDHEKRKKDWAFTKAKGSVFVAELVDGIVKDYGPKKDDRGFGKRVYEETGAKAWVDLGKGLGKGVATGFNAIFNKKKKKASVIKTPRTAVVSNMNGVPVVVNKTSTNITNITNETTNIVNNSYSEYD